MMLSRTKVAKRLQQLTKALLNTVVYPIGIIMPRSRKRWVFGHQGDTFAGNAKYLFLWMTLNRPDIDVVWLTGDKVTRDSLAASGYKSYLRWSWSGIRVALFSRVFVFCHSVVDTNLQLSRGALLLNLWHGVGLKPIQLNEKGSVISQHLKYQSKLLTKAFYLGSLVKPDWVVTTSDFTQKHFADQFGMDIAACPKLGYPRLDVVADPILLEAAKVISPSQEIDADFGAFKEVYMYMPTFRDSGRPFLEEALPDLEELSEALRQRNALLYIKLHRKTELEFASTFPNIKPWPEQADCYIYLFRFNLLITDYSSILYDYIFYKGAGVIIYTFDFDKYQKFDRSLLYSFEENIIGTRISDFAGLCLCIAEGTALAAISPCDLGRIRDKFWGECAAPVSPQIVTYIESQIYARRKSVRPKLSYLSRLRT